MAAAVADVATVTTGPRSRVGRHRGDHQLHEHLEPERDDWRGARRQEGGRARAVAQAVGEDQPGARVEGGDGVPAEVGPRAVPRSARLQPRWLRLHDVHRQQRAAARRGQRRSRIAQPRRRLGAERQPQLRGTHSAAGARELPRVAAARRRLRACGPHDDRPDDRAARDGPGGRAGVSARAVADRARDSGDDAELGDVGDVPDAVRGRVRRRRSLEDASRADRQPVRLGPRFDLHPQPAVLRRAHAADDAAQGHHRARACSPSSATASRPITSRLPDRSRRTARRAST